MIKKCNDMLEQHPLLTAMQKEEIERLKEKIERSNVDIKLAQTNFDQSFQPYGEQKSVNKFWKSAAVSCLSESNDSKLMWSHYASNNRGMCIEYDTQELVQNTHFIMAPINYASEPPSRREYVNSEPYLMHGKRMKEKEEKR